MACCALLQAAHGALLLALRYFSDMLHLPQLYEWAFGAFMAAFVERDLVPDALLRRGIRLLLRKRLAEVRLCAAQRSAPRRAARALPPLCPAPAAGGAPLLVRLLLPGRARSRTYARRLLQRIERCPARARTHTPPPPPPRPTSSAHPLPNNTHNAIQTRCRARSRRRRSTRTASSTSSGCCPSRSTRPPPTSSTTKFPPSTSRPCSGRTASTAAACTTARATASRRPRRACSVSRRGGGADAGAGGRLAGRKRAAAKKRTISSSTTSSPHLTVLNPATRNQQHEHASIPPHTHTHTRTALYCVRAGLIDGQDILELGCGWGSFSLFAARAFPRSRVTAVSNSRTQRDYIMRRARELGVSNLEVITADVVEFQVGGRSVCAVCVLCVCCGALSAVCALCVLCVCWGAVACCMPCNCRASCRHPPRALLPVQLPTPHPSLHHHHHHHQKQRQPIARRPAATTASCPSRCLST